MPETRKPELERMVVAKAARLLRMSRNGVMQRLARRLYPSEVIGGVTFVIADERFLADVRAADEAAQQGATTQAVA